MARKIRDAQLDNRTQRLKLKPRHKPHFKLIEPGLHLGYRRLASGPGTWIVRRYVGGGRYVTANLREGEQLCIADDFADADGKRVLSFGQAQRKAQGPRAARGVGGYSVADAMADYIAYLEGDGRSARAIEDARYRSEALIVPVLGTAKLAALTPERLRMWRDELARKPARVRTRKGAAQQYRKPSDDPETIRRRRASARRTFAVLRAALNLAFHEGHVDSDAAWRKVRPHKGVDVAKVRFLTVAESKRLLNAAEADFRALLRAALETGCRYGELCELKVADVDPDAGTVHVRTSKTGKARFVHLSDEGVKFFRQLCAGRAGTATLLTKADGEPWGRAHQGDRMRAACKRARIEPAVGFHVTRHTAASLAVMNGAPLLAVAANLGHADGRMTEKHYAHLSAGFVRDSVRKFAPRFGAVERGKIVGLR
jgi:integrase